MEFKSSGQTHVRKLSAPLIVVAILLQLAVAPFISVLGARFNFMVVLAIVGSMGLDSRTAVFFGFLAGLFYDLTAPVPVGLMALLLAVCAYLVASGSRGIAAGFNADSVRIACVSVFVVVLLYALVMFFMGIEGSFFKSFFVVGLLSSLLDCVACIPFLMLSGRNEQARGFSASPYSKMLRFKQRR